MTGGSSTPASLAARSSSPVRVRGPRPSFGFAARVDRRAKERCSGFRCDRVRDRLRDYWAYGLSALEAILQARAGRHALCAACLRAFCISLVRKHASLGSCCNDESAAGIHDGAILDGTTFFQPSILRAQALICSLREDLHRACLDPNMGWYAEVDALCHLA